MEHTQVVKSLQINYKESGTGPVFVLLHGWGSNLEVFNQVINHFQNDFRVIAIDLPGFGKSQSPNEVWGVLDYTDFIEEFFRLNGIQNPILAGHSFGGRISIVYASRNPVSKLLLLDSAGIKPKRKLSYYIKVYSYKLVRKTLPFVVGAKKAEEILYSYRKKVGSSDYQNSSGIIRQIMVKVVNEDLKHLMPKIKAPTLLIWGENDTATPVSDGKIMEKLIPGSGLVVLKNAGHFAFLDKMSEFLIILNSFLKNDKQN